MLRLVNNYTLLLTSHVLSGTAAALQYSVFEAWYVSEHISRGFPSEWRARTFAVATFLNGLVAIVAGVVANAAVNMWGFSAPFLISMALLGVASSTITLTWSENYGESSEISTTKRSLTATILDGCRSMWNGKICKKNELLIQITNLCFPNRYKYNDSGSSADSLWVCHVHICSFVHSGCWKYGCNSWYVFSNIKHWMNNIRTWSIYRFGWDPVGIHVFNDDVCSHAWFSQFPNPWTACILILVIFIFTMVHSQQTASYSSGCS